VLPGIFEGIGMPSFGRFQGGGLGDSNGGNGSGSNSDGVAVRPLVNPAQGLNERLTVMPNPGDAAALAAGPQTALVLIKKYSGGPGVVKRFFWITTDTNTISATQFYVFIDGAPQPLVTFQGCHIGRDLKSANTPDANFCYFGNDRMSIQFQVGPSGNGGCRIDFAYEQPFGQSVEIWASCRQPRQTIWADAIIVPEATDRGYRLVGNTVNSGFPTYSATGQNSLPFAGHTITSPVDGVTQVVTPTCPIGVTPAQLADGSLKLLDIPAGKAGRLACLSLGVVDATAQNWMENNLCLYAPSQLVGDKAPVSQRPIVGCTGFEDGAGGAFFFARVGSFGPFYIPEWDAATGKMRIITDFLHPRSSGWEFTNGARLTFVGGGPGWAEPGNFSTGSAGTSTNVTMSWLALAQVWNN
jgi:hypothetical protein